MPAKLTVVNSLVNGVLLAQFPGTAVPPWLAEAVVDGLAGVCLFAENTPDVATTRRLTDELQGYRTSGPPLIVALDEEGGDVTRLQAATGSSLPGQAPLGVVDDPNLTEIAGARLGRVLRLAGVTLDLAPVLDVSSEPLNPVIGVRSFGADPALVERHGRAFVAGLHQAGVAACGKHFPGHGATVTDSHESLPILDLDLATLADRDELPFTRVGLDAVMTAHVVVPSLGPEPASLSRWATDRVRAAGIAGPIVTDALGMRAIEGRYDLGEACVRALAAGADLLCLDAPQNRDAETAFRTASAAIQSALDEGRLSPDALRESALRTAALARRTAGQSGRPARVSEEEIHRALADLDAVGVEIGERSVGVRSLSGRPSSPTRNRRFSTPTTGQPSLADEVSVGSSTPADTDGATPADTDGATPADTDAATPTDTYALRSSETAAGCILFGRAYVIDLRRTISAAAGAAAPTFAAELERRGKLSGVSAPTTPDEARKVVDSVRASSPHAPQPADASAVPQPQILAIVRQPWADHAEAELLDAVLNEDPDAIVIHTGVAAAAPVAQHVVCCHGNGRANARATVDILCSGTPPTDPARTPS